MFRTITLNLVALLSLLVVSSESSAVLVSFNPTKDTRIYQGGANSNRGGFGEVQIGNVNASSGQIRTLLEFDVSSLAGQYESIDSITLRMYSQSTTNNLISNAGGDTGITIFVHQISDANAGWIEGTDTNQATAGTGFATWNNKNHDVAPWDGNPGLLSAGTDYVTTPLSSLTLTAVPTANAPVDFIFTGDLTGLINNWQAVNAGLLLRSNSPTNNERLFFHSKESAINVDGIFFPAELIVSYTVAPIPEPSTGLLFGLGSLCFLGASRKRRQRTNQGSKVGI